jgi:hypothetical protein
MVLSFMSLMVHVDGWFVLLYPTGQPDVDRSRAGAAATVLATATVPLTLFHLVDRFSWLQAGRLASLRQTSMTFRMAPS